jgi:hypothetical protein
MGWQLQIQFAFRTCAVLSAISVQFFSIALVGIAQPSESHHTSVVEPGGFAETTNLVMTLASEAVNSDSNYLGRLRFEVNSKHETVRFDLRPVPLRYVLPPSDPLATPVELMIRVMSLQRDFKRNLKTNETFWIQPLDQATEAVFQAIQSRTKVDGGSVVSASTHLDSAETSIQSLQSAILDFSERNGLDMELFRDTEYFTVHVVVSDQALRVRYVQYLDFLKSRHGLSIEDDWIDVGRGKHDLPLIGEYHFVIEWPSSLGGFETNDYDIERNTELSIEPRQMPK